MQEVMELLNYEANSTTTRTLSIQNSFQNTFFSTVQNFTAAVVQ